MNNPEKPQTDEPSWINVPSLSKEDQTTAQPAIGNVHPSNPAPLTTGKNIKKVQPAEKKSTSGPGIALTTFWTVASVLSVIVNVILIVVLLVLARELFVLKAIVGNNLLGGLYENFIFMDQAHIKTEITVKDNIPIDFTLPISQDTVVTLTGDTPINGAMVRLNSGGVTINSPANIVLPAGTNLPVHLELKVPVTTLVPITLKVPVDIALDQTDLHKPFIGLQQVVAPFYQMLMPQYKTANDIPACKSAAWLCNFIFAAP